MKEREEAVVGERSGREEGKGLSRKEGKEGWTSRRGRNVLQEEKKTDM